MSLGEQGWKFMVSPDRTRARWAHGEQAEGYAQCGWHDCTGMTGQQFYDFMKGKQ